MATSNGAKASAFCWGNTVHGQLGLGDIDQENVTVPTELEIYRNRLIEDITCGGNHTVFVMKDGTVYSCGNNDCGQLGCDSSKTSPEPLDTLSTQVIKQVASGMKHNVAINELGQVFTWGDHSMGQLGRGYTDQVFNKTPKLVKELSSHVAVQVACGYNHAIVLTDNGKLFSWGYNMHGQLGLGIKNDKRDTPEEIKSLKGVATVKLAAGGNHTFILTISGALYGWGKNSSGQLGQGNTNDQVYPSQCKTLRTQKIKHMACGEDHTAVITSEGGVFTFGSGSNGQLGHNSLQPEYLPKRVFELMGSVVTQIACGRHHTVAYVPSSGRIYAFGLGVNGQLGVGKETNTQSPQTVKGPWVSHEKLDVNATYQTSKEVTFVVNQLFAGGDHCFVTVTDPKEKIAPKDFRKRKLETQILTLTDDRIHNYYCIGAKDKPSTVVVTQVERIFSSASCLNGSFLLGNDQHFACGGKNPGVDMKLAKEMFEKIGKIKNPVIIDTISGAIEKGLLPNLIESPPDHEALRLYLTMVWFHLFDNPESYPTIITPFGKALLSLEKTPAKVIELWWARHPTEHFLRNVVIYKRAVVHILCLPNPTSDFEIIVRQRSLQICLEVIKRLNSVNNQNGQIITYDLFYIHELKEKVDIRQDYINWIKQARTTGSNVVCFCDYPFVFDAQAKTMLLHTDAMLQMQMAVDEVHRRNFSSLFMPIDPVCPCLVLYVTRNNIVQDTINQLAKQGSCDFKKPLKVTFIGEEALDGGGVRKEFFMLLLREIMDPKYGMFQYFEESRFLWFNQQSFEDNVMFSLIGVLCGLAIYNATIIDLRFPLALYKKLLRKEVILSDYTELQPSVGKSLKQLLEHEEDNVEDVFCLVFEISVETVYGEVKHVELQPNGANIPVTKSNRQQYVDLYVDFFLNKSVHDQFQAFYDGFHKVCGGRVLDFFHPQELQAMVVGNENYDWNELEKNCDYKGVFYRNHETIKYFWEVFNELTKEQKKKFLLFLTGSDRIPIHGMSAVKIIIQPVGGGEDFLPVAHTCFNVLDLPKYTSKDTLKRKLLQAIEHSEGFGLV